MPLLLMHLTKWGLAWTRVLSRLSSLVWKSCVNVEIGSSPFNLEKKSPTIAMSLDILARSTSSYRSVCEVGDILKLTPLGTVSLAYRAFNSLPNKWVAKPKLHVCL